MSEAKLYVQLLTYTPSPAAAVAMGARLCYSGDGIEALSEKVSESDQSAYLQRLTDMGHMSPVEHASFTFGVQGVSRALLAQITRHRLASFSVQSQRYVGQTAGGINYIVPPSIKARGATAVKRYKAQIEQMGEWYDEWVREMGKEFKEDARFVLPNAVETRFVMTMNARELRHMFALRCCNRAQWEIRAMAWAMLGHCLAAAPELFDGCAPPCVMSNCTEGRMSCGRANEMKALFYEKLLPFVKANSKENDFAARISGWASKNVTDACLNNK